MISCKHKYGEITALLSNKRYSWFLVGTSRGILLLWDSRFLICLKVWTYPSKGRIYKIVSCLRDSGKLVLVASENEISLWDISAAKCLQIWCNLKAFNKDESLEAMSSKLYSNGFEVQF